MEISHRRDIIGGFLNCENIVMGHMKSFNEIFLFLNDSMTNMSEIMVSDSLLI